MSGDEIPIYQRKCMGFIVEGFGEFHAYPTIVHRYVNGSHTPVSNARGNGNLLCHINENIEDLITVHKPYAIIITMDLIENVKEGLATDAEDLIKKVSECVEEWKKGHGTKPKYQPLPEHWYVALQIQKFETWIIGDVENLVEQKLVELKHDETYDSIMNIDITIPNSSSWLKERMIKTIDLKKQKQMKDLWSGADHQRIINRSNSFAKFVGHVREAYLHWEFKCNEGMTSALE